MPPSGRECLSLTERRTLFAEVSPIPGPEGDPVADVRVVGEQSRGASVNRAVAHRRAHLRPAREPLPRDVFGVQAAAPAAARDYLGRGVAIRLDSWRPATACPPPPTSPRCAPPPWGSRNRPPPCRRSARSGRPARWCRRSSTRARRPPAAASPTASGSAEAPAGPRGGRRIVGGRAAAGGRQQSGRSGQGQSVASLHLGCPWWEFVRAARRAGRCTSRPCRRSCRDVERVEDGNHQVVVGEPLPFVADEAAGPQPAPGAAGQHVGGVLAGCGCSPWPARCSRG